MKQQKEICQLSRKPIAHKVRKYFIQVDNLLKKYYEYIIYGLNEKQEMITMGKKPVIHPMEAIMYIFKTNVEGDFKVGTTRKPKKRAREHNCANSKDLELVFRYEIKDKKRVDSCVKNVLKPWLTRNDREIYKLKLEKIKEVIVKCDEMR